MRISDWSSDVCSSDLGQPHSQPHVLLPGVDIRAQPYAPYQPWDYSIRSRINALPRTVVGAPTGTLPDEILTPGKGQVRALICSGSNPMVSLPDQMRAFEALGSLDLLVRSEEHRSELQSLMRISYAVFCLKKKIENT